MKIVNDSLIAEYRKRGPCRHCGRIANLCGAHIFGKGAGQVDIPANLVCLGADAVLDCPCHHDSHLGHEPLFERLLAYSAAEHNTLAADIEDLVMLIRRMPRIGEVSRSRCIATFQRELRTFSARKLAFEQLKSFEHLLAEES